MNNFNHNPEEQLPSASDPAARCDALLELARKTVENQYALAIEIALDAYNLALETKDQLRQALSLEEIGRAQLRLHLYDQALNSYQTAGNLYLELESQKNLARVKMMEGNAYLRQNEFIQALECHFQSLPILLEYKMTLYESKCRMSIGVTYSFMGDNAQALEYYFQAFKLIELNPEYFHEQGSALLNIGDALHRLKRLDEALIYSEKSLQIACENNQLRMQSVVLVNLGEIHNELGDFEKARINLEEGLKISRELPNQYEQARAINAFCYIYSQTGENQLLKQSYEEALQIAHEIKSVELVINVELTQAKHLHRTNQKDKAAALTQQIAAKAEKFKLLGEVANAHELLFTIYKQQNNYQKALEHYEQYVEVKQKIHGAEQIKRTEALLIKQEMEKQRHIAEAQSRLNAELQAANKQIRILLEQSEYRAAHDRLTGLPNRTLFEDRLEQTLTHAARSNEKFAVLFLDLDGFKAVNDTLGHDAGDELLVQVAKRLKKVLRESDTIARQGGDEFTVIVKNLRKHDDARGVACKLLKSLDRKFDIFENQVAIGVSIGISFYPLDGTDACSLQKKADSAMYFVKQSGKAGFQCYSPSNHALISSELILPM